MERGGGEVVRHPKLPNGESKIRPKPLFNHEKSTQRGVSMTLEFGIFAPFNLREGHTEHEAFREWLDLACIADDLGVDCFWLAGFHFTPPPPISAPLVVGSALAQRTKRINVGLGVQLLPLANPLRLAEEVATLD